MKEERFIELFDKGLIFDKPCQECGRPILTVKGIFTVEQWCEETSSIDAGEFSDPRCAYEEFCDGPENPECHEPPCKFFRKDAGCTKYDDVNCVDCSNWHPDYGCQVM